LPRKVTAVFAKGKHLSFEEALDKLPEILGESYYENSAMNTILRQEIDRYNRLLTVIFKSMEELNKAMKGEIMISKTCENMINSFLVQKVPKEWELNAYASLKPLASWLKNLFKRTKFFSCWCRTMIVYVETALATNSLPTALSRDPFSIWMSGFIFPQGLLAAISQNYARKYRTSIDSLEFRYEIRNEICDEQAEMVDDVEGLFERERFTTTLGEEGVLLCGLLIDGAKWDRASQILLDSAQRFTVLPHIMCKLVEVNIKGGQKIQK
jgi:dynein heavy chain